MSLPARARSLKNIFEALQDINLEGQIVDQETDQVSLGFSCDVFRATLVRDGKVVPVAVKRIRRVLLDDLSFASDLGREVRLWSKLDHSNVLPLLGYFLEGEKSVPNLVSGWCEHGTVTEYMKDRPFDGYEICNLLWGIASGLLYIHTKHNMIHADLKCSNILVSDDRKPLLADFGLSVSSSSTSLAATTFHGLKGSLRWMARELHFSSVNNIQPPSKHTTMSDIWAFGMVIYEFLARKIPYHHIASRSVPDAILAGKLPLAPDFHSDDSIFFRLWNIGLHCWHNDPQRRPSASELNDVLKSFVEDLDDGHAKNGHSSRSPVDLSQSTNESSSYEDGTSDREVEGETALQVVKSEWDLYESYDSLPHFSPEGSNFGGEYKLARRPILSKRPVIPINQGFQTLMNHLLIPSRDRTVSLKERHRSPIIGLKCFKNWVKAVLFRRFARYVLREWLPDDNWMDNSGRVLDIGCGKGGDLKKWAKAQIREYVGLDISENALNEARSRYSSRSQDFEAMFVKMDCFSLKLSDVFDTSVLEPLFDVVSMQFCVQNAFESVQKTMTMLDNVSKWLRKGGVFVGTMPNEQVLLDNLDRLPPSELSFGNSVYQVRFEDRDRRPSFGHRYWLSMYPLATYDAEYVAHWDTFVQMASEYGLELQYKSGFHDFYAEHCDHEVYGSLLQRMEVVNANCESPMNEDQWEAGNLYLAFVFKKL